MPALRRLPPPRRLAAAAAAGCLSLAALACLSLTACSTTRPPQQTIAPAYSMLTDDPALAARIMLDQAEPVDAAALGRLPVNAPLTQPVP
jgi:hypothetical protein